MRVFSVQALLLRPFGYRHDTPRAFAPSLNEKSIASENLPKGKIDYGNDD
jgi:hypothetical protein